MPPRDAETFDRLIRRGAAMLPASPSPMLDARILFKNAAAIDDAQLIARGGDIAPPALVEKFMQQIERRAAGEPVAQITGVKEFWGLPFSVNRHVLTPRADSESLIECVIDRRPADAPLSILDLGTGSGCLLAALMHEFSNARGIGVDRSAEAAATARRNLAALGLEERSAIVVGDWNSAIGNRFDIVISNPPYIRRGEIAGLDADVRDYEPQLALDGGADGLDAYRWLAGKIGKSLAPGGLLILEIGCDQADAVVQLLRENFAKAEIGVITDLAARPRGVYADGGKSR